MNKPITLTIAGTDFAFTVGTAEYNDYLNGLMPDNKVQPNHNLVIRTVAPEQKEALLKVLEANPGAALQIGGLLAQDYAPQIEITVKK